MLSRFFSSREASGIHLLLVAARAEVVRAGAAFLEARTDLYRRCSDSLIANVYSLMSPTIFVVIPLERRCELLFFWTAAFDAVGRWR